jgi:ADP-ribose pyrophosphatase
VSGEGWRTHERRVLHHVVYRIEEHDVERPDGVRMAMAAIYSPDTVKVVPVTNEGQIAFARQWRHVLGRTLLELPAGRVEAGEAAEDAARRELHEEVSLVPGALRHLGTFQASPGLLDQTCALYLAADCSEDPEARPDEPVERVLLSWDDALGRIGGEIEDTTSALALLLAREAMRA